MTKVLLTGGSGFLGGGILNRLILDGFPATTVVRRTLDGFPKAIQKEIKSSFDGEVDWSGCLASQEVVIHCAARAHVLRDMAVDPVAEFRNVNVNATLKLARQSLEAGVRRFIFISSIGVNGAQTSSAPFTERSEPLPHADYALSKFEAEQGLRKLVKGTGMELVIVRPPLVYASHAPGNFQRLLKLVSMGLPLPFASVRNQRSMIALESLVDFITRCIDHPAAANELFLISDGIDFSTAEIVRYLAAGMGRKACLLPMSDGLMRWGSRLLGKEGMYAQLCGSLVIDSSKARNLLGWTPPVTPEKALFKAGQDYRRLVASRT